MTVLNRITECVDVSQARFPGPIYRYDNALCVCDFFFNSKRYIVANSDTFLVFMSFTIQSNTYDVSTHGFFIIFWMYVENIFIMKAVCIPGDKMRQEQSYSFVNRVLDTDFSLLPAETKFWPRWYFYTCLSFCSQGGVLLARPPPGMETPLEQTPPPDGDPPRWRTPPGWRTPPDGEPPLDGEPPRMENPPRWRTPPMEEPPGWSPPSPPKQTPAYGLRSAGTHPTGMHSC